MVIITSPPSCLRKPRPKFYRLKKGTELLRIFRPDEFNTDALTFRFWGPLHRFDHHLGECSCVGVAQENNNTCGLWTEEILIPEKHFAAPACYKPLERKAWKDPERGIYYAAPAPLLSSCLVEVFGDTGCIEITDHQIAMITCTSRLKLLDVRGSGAMRAGANEATLAKTDKRGMSQAWSRYFYEQKEIYPDIQGIIYHNAHNGEEAIAIYESAKDLLTCLPESIYSLKHELFRGAILKAADENNLEVERYW
ncbi:MAG: RES domain-containing protein [Brasilonema octagenarum HA4186-MV1]|uniref:RES domain-containing protein n=2 Tax=Brasilonema TaxID=383614 RepID=A0A856MMM9_9CYAN|nr:RES domain-containing protein [Brasilonema sennae]MBW4629314.1 RES domain-containing protein [Brasilonema octagenarum HA4186-MV1]NMF64150.1 RES domain-containing protein [Brasilonema octagenarum UFV-OR1]QDL11772.1 RES domain-containing protein [Brasilonema sennae CENA114]QDL18153.1 RES domain-containing protein [Brasilonema octagenarum UFV-E1]